MKIQGSFLNLKGMESKLYANVSKWHRVVVHFPPRGLPKQIQNPQPLLPVRVPLDYCILDYSSGSLSTCDGVCEFFQHNTTITNLCSLPVCLRLQSKGEQFFFINS